MGNKLDESQDAGYVVEPVPSQTDFVNNSRCKSKDAGKKLLELIWVETDKSVDTRKFYRDCVPGNTRRRSSAMPLIKAVKALVSIMTLERETSKLRHHDISGAHFQLRAQRLIYIRLPAEDRQKYGEDKVVRLTKSMYGTQDASQPLDYVTLICGELGGFRGGKHSAALFHNSNEDVRMTVHDDDFVCLPDND